MGELFLEEDGVFNYHLIRHLLPNSQHLKLEQTTVEPDTGRMILSLIGTQTQACCPVCQHPSGQVHSHYERTLRDLNWANTAVLLQVTVRKFFCRNPSCRRRIFSERLQEFVQPWFRRTNAMTHQLNAMGLALGGTAGARLLRRLGYGFSRDGNLNN